MKTFFAILLFAAASISYAQNQTDSSRSVKLNTSITIASKNIWRGVNYGNNVPMIQGTLGVVVKNAFEIGACGTATLNGDKRGFGNWMELYTQYQWKRWTIVLDDYYFFSYDSLNDYLNWSNKTTQHLLEARVKFEIPDKLSLMAGYNIYASQYAKKALYVEAEYFLFENFSLLFGAVTGASWLNYYDSGGITTIGVSGSRKIPIWKKINFPLKAQLIVNPNYKKIATWDGSGYVDPGYNFLGRNAINFVVSTTF